jgi:hypothetical protein
MEKMRMSECQSKWEKHITKYDIMVLDLKSVHNTYNYGCLVTSSEDNMYRNNRLDCYHSSCRVFLINKAAIFLSNMVCNV